MSPITLISVAILNILCISYFLYRDQERERLLNALRQKNAALEDLLGVMRLKIKTENDRAMSREE